MTGRILTGVTVLVIAAFVLIPRIARSDPLELIRRHAGAAPPPAAVPIVLPQLGKFQAVGRVTSTVVPGSGCAGSPFATCNTCDQLQISGPLVLTPGGKATLTACMNIGSGLSTCDDEQGNGTLTLAGGDTITFATGGHFCIADEIPPANPTTIAFISTGGYTIEGGTGKQSAAVGQGEFSISLIQNGNSTTGAGEFDLQGTYAKE